MNLKALGLGLTMAAFLAVPATLADNVNAIYCPGCNFDEEGGFSRVISNSAGVSWTGGVVDCGWGENTVGVVLSNTHLNQITFDSTSTGCADPCVFYEYTYSGGSGGGSCGVSSSTNSRTGVTRWSFNAANAGLPRGARITALFFIDSSCYPFSDKVYNIHSTGGVHPIPGKTEDCDL